MRTIWKYEIPIQDTFELEIPIGSYPLYVETVNGVPCIYYQIIDTTHTKEKSRFCIVGTGHALPSNYFLIGYFIQHNFGVDLVWWVLCELK